MVRSRADEHLPLPPACPDAVERRDARDLRRCRDPAEHAGFRGGAGARRGRARRHSGKRCGTDHECVQGRIIRPRRAGRGRDAVRQSRHPPGQGADRQRRQGGRGGRALRALGRDQPGRDRYRRHARPCAPASTRCSPISIAPSRALPGWRVNIAIPPVVARTWLQHALPMPFGLKLAEYAAALHRSKLRLQRLRGETLALQFGGAAGTLAALGDKGLQVAEKLARRIEAAAARCALAHPPRPHRGSGLGVRHHRRHLRQDRARRFADDADRCRRSLRAVGRRPRRLLHHAAQAQSGRGRQRARRGHHGAQSRGDDLCRAGAGPRAQRRPLARGMADACRR